MTKPLSASVEVAADVETAFAVLSGASWPGLMADRLQDGSTLVEATATPDGGARLVSSRKLPDGVPGFLSAFLPADGRTTQTDVWGPAVGGVRRGTWSVTFPGSPGEVGGENLVEPTASGARWTVTGTVRIGIPLLGGRAEGFLAPLAEKLARRQGEVLREVLGRGGA